MTSPERLILATRGSRLARTQTEIVAKLLRRAHPGIEIEILVVTTTGDRDARPFASIGSKGIFTTEVERAVIEGRADGAVHSAKDLTAELAQGCVIAALPPRASAHDVVVGGLGETGEERLASLPSGATVGTSSMRRRSQLAELRGDLEVVELRGNLDTRIRKVERGEVDAAILAAAGLERLGLDVKAAPLDPQRWVPAPAQGALAIETLVARAAAFASLDDPAARAEVGCERAFAATLEGGCTVPLGCHARVAGDQLIATGYLGSPEGTALRDRISGVPGDAVQLGTDLARALLDAGGRELLDSLERSAVPEVVEP